MRKYQLAVVSTISGFVFTSGALAASLPGGAGSLVETYQNWVVACRAPEGKAVCAMRQVQNNQNGQHVLTAELRTGADGKLQGNLLMPFGLALGQGVALAVDEKAGPTFAFSTCVPQGCIAPMRFDAGVVENLKSGDTLNVTAHAVNAAEPVAFTISLKGFTAALDRMRELTQ